MPPMEIHHHHHYQLVSFSMARFAEPATHCQWGWHYPVRHWVHLGPEYAETKDGFKCVNKKNIVPRGPKLKWLAAMDPHKFPTRDWVQDWGMEAFGFLGDASVLLLVLLCSICCFIALVNTQAMN